MEYGILSLIPILVCFAFIFISRNAFVAITLGIVTAVIIIFTQSSDFVLFTAVIDVFSSISTMQTVLFILIVGAMIKATELSGGVNGLISYLEKKKINVTSPVLAQLFAMFMGMCLFVDATSSMAVTAVVGKPLFDKAKLSKEKLAIITNATAAPIAWLIPFGGAGALTTSLIAGVDGISGNAFGYVIGAMPFQLYTICLLLFLFLSIVLRFEVGSIKNYKYEELENSEKRTTLAGKARNLVIPIVILIVSIGVILIVTGDGDILKGNSSDAVFYGGIVTLLLTLMFYKLQNICTVKVCLGWFFGGIKSMLVVTILLAVALVFSDLLAKIRTANYLVSLLGEMSPNLFPVIVLLLSAIIGFSTGTSGGTVAIVSGLVLPMAVMLDVNISLILGAIVSGAVFGDQSTIISDSVILTSSVTKVNSIVHVKTQLPYTITALSISAVLYLILGFIL